MEPALAARQEAEYYLRQLQTARALREAAVYLRILLEEERKKEA